MSTDQFSETVNSISAPASASVPIQPSDTDALGAIPRAIFVGSGGDITMRGKNDDGDRLWRNVPSGALIPFRAALVRASGTTAADMLALY